MGNITDPYNITTETDGHGSIEVVPTAYANDRIVFTVTPLAGYKIGKITITDKNGNSITFTEENITQDENGTVTIHANGFTMPASDVTIRVGFEKTLVNPKTGVSSPLLALFVFLMLGVGLYIWSNRSANLTNIN